MPKFLKSSQNNHQAKKCQYIYIKGQFGSQKHLQQTTYETVKYVLENMFWKYLFRWKCKKMLQKKTVQIVAISLGHFIFKEVTLGIQN